MAIRRGPGTIYRRLVSLKHLAGRDRRAVLEFLRAPYPIALSLRDRLGIVAAFVHTTNHVRTYHTQVEMLAVADRILRLAGRDGLTVVECGAGKGGSTAKLSLVTKLAGGRLHVFDSFKGIPPNDERDARLDGKPIEFRRGAFRGRIHEVQRNVARFGALDVCEFHKGWFADTMPAFTAPVDVVLLDVDLASSTRTCVTALYPRLRPGGVMFSQDGHLRGTVELLANAAFWRDELGVPPPAIAGLGRDKLVAIPAPG